MPHSLRTASRRALVVALALALLTALQPAAHLRAVTPVFINEIHYDNASTDSGEAIEVAGPAGTDLSAYSLVLYNGNGGAPYDTDALSGTIPDQQGGMGTLAFAYATNGIQNGAPDGIALVMGTTVLQFLSYEGTFAAVGGPADGMISTDIGVEEGSSTPAGYSLQLTGAGTAYEDFSWASEMAETFGSPNTGQSFGFGAVAVDCGGSLTLLEGDGGSRSVTASDENGTVVDISIVSVTPDPGTITIGATTPAAGVGGTASADISIGSGTAVGSYDVLVQATNDDAEPQTGQCTLSVSVESVLTVGEVQGATEDGENGLTDASPYAGESVYVRAVVTEYLRFATSSGSRSYGAFLQSRVGATDGDPQSSDGIFIYLGFYGDVPNADAPGYYTPTVGDEIVLRASVSEYFNLTELSSGSLIRVEASGIDVTDPAQIETTEASPPDDLADANRFWERHEGMRFHVDADAAVVAARDVFASTQDGEVWVIRGDHPIAQRADPYQRIVYRDPHPLDDIGPAGSFDNGNGMRILLTSHGLKGIADSNDALIAPARTYDTVTNELTGGLYFAFGKYGIEIEQQLALSSGVDPALNAPPAAVVAGEEFSTSDYNVENLYDYRDDPFDGCDFAGNSGCPGVFPPFDYVPASEAAYLQHIGDLAAQINGPMHAPDLLMIQEAEDQDICSVVAGAMDCGTTNNADGKPDTLQDLALAIAALGGPTYDAAFDRDGADDRGIISAFLYRTDTVELVAADASDPVLGSSPTVDYRGTALSFNTDVQNPKALNADLPADVDLSTGVDGSNVYTRAPQVGHFRIWRDGVGTSVFTDLYAISNHFSSNPNGRVGQRTEQALYNAAIVDALEGAGVTRIISAGDFNVYPRPDDPFEPPNESDQLGPMYDAGLHNLYDTLLAEVPQSAYSYSFQGQAQTLDMQWATGGQFADLVQVRAGHFNADFAADYDGDVARGASDHDPQLARWSNDVTLDRLHALVDYYVGTGDITNGKAKVLHRRLNRAWDAMDAGRTVDYQLQLKTFGLQAQGLAPAHVSQGAADVLQAEADRLAAMS